MKDRYGCDDYSEALARYAGGSLTAAVRALLALALATGEERVTNWGGASGISRRHMELLAAAGYEPGDADRHHLTGETGEAGGDVDEPRCCRGCGCTDEEPCHGGCHWVEDPDQVGDLCSRCLEDIEAEEEAAAQ